MFYEDFLFWLSWLFWFVHFQKLKPLGRDRQSKSLTMPCAWRQRPTAILFAAQDWVAWCALTYHWDVLMTCLQDIIAFQCLAFRRLGHFQLRFSCYARQQHCWPAAPMQSFDFKVKDCMRNVTIFPWKKCHASCHDRRDGANSGGKTQFAWCLGFGFSLQFDLNCGINKCVIVCRINAQERFEDVARWSRMGW